MYTNKTLKFMFSKRKLSSTTSKSSLQSPSSSLSLLLSSIKSLSLSSSNVMAIINNQQQSQQRQQQCNMALNYEQKYNYNNEKFHSNFNLNSNFNRNNNISYNHHCYYYYSFIIKIIIIIIVNLSLLSSPLSPSSISVVNCYENTNILNDDYSSLNDEYSSPPTSISSTSTSSIDFAKEVERQEPILLNQIEKANAAFKCQSDGYFADVSYGCQFYHVCENTNSPYDKPSYVKHTFSCVNGTVFNQLSFTCTRYDDSIPCEISPSYFYLNKRNGNPKAYFLTDDDITKTPITNGGGGSGGGGLSSESESSSSSAAKTTSTTSYEDQLIDDNDNRNYADYLNYHRRQQQNQLPVAPSLEPSSSISSSYKHHPNHFDHHHEKQKPNKQLINEPLLSTNQQLQQRSRNSPIELPSPQPLSMTTTTTPIELTNDYNFTSDYNEAILNNNHNYSIYDFDPNYHYIRRQPSAPPSSSSSSNSIGKHSNRLIDNYSYNDYDNSSSTNTDQTIKLINDIPLDYDDAYGINLRRINRTSFEHNSHGYNHSNVHQIEQPRQSVSRKRNYRKHRIQTDAAVGKKNQQQAQQSYLQQENPHSHHHHHHQPIIAPPYELEPTIETYGTTFNDNDNNNRYSSIQDDVSLHNLQNENNNRYKELSSTNKRKNHYITLDHQHSNDLMKSTSPVSTTLTPPIISPSPPMPLIDKKTSLLDYGPLRKSPQLPSLPEPVIIRAPSPSPPLPKPPTIPKFVTLPPPIAPPTLSPSQLQSPPLIQSIPKPVLRDNNYHKKPINESNEMDSYQYLTKTYSIQSPSPSTMFEDSIEESLKPKIMIANKPTIYNNNRSNFTANDNDNMINESFESSNESLNNQHQQHHHTHNKQTFTPATFSQIYIENQKQSKLDPIPESYLRLFEKQRSRLLLNEQQQQQQSQEQTSQPPSIIKGYDYLNEQLLSSLSTTQSPSSSSSNITRSLLNYRDNNNNGKTLPSSSSTSTLPLSLSSRSLSSSSSPSSSLPSKYEQLIAQSLSSKNVANNNGQSSTSTHSIAPNHFVTIASPIHLLDDTKNTLVNVDQQGEQPVKISFINKNNNKNIANSDSKNGKQSSSSSSSTTIYDYGQTNYKVVKQIKGKNLLIDPSLENDPERDNIIAQVLEMLNKYN